jgi:chromosome partitioning protein
VIAFASSKGGVGKTHLSALLARFYAAQGLRVLAVDSDLNDSLSYHFLNGVPDEVQKKRAEINYALALSSEKNNLCEYTLSTRTTGVDLIATTPYISDLRAINDNRLKRMIPTLYGKYDVCIIDCPPTYDNIILNGVNAADYTITPVLKDVFSYNAVKFLSEVFPRDVQDFKNWYVLINGYDKRYEEAKSGRQLDFIDAYRNAELPLLPAETWLPWTNHIHLLVDYYQNLSCVKGKVKAVYNPDLHKAIAELAQCFVDSELDNAPEVF